MMNFSSGGWNPLGTFLTFAIVVVVLAALAAGVGVGMLL